MRALWCFVIVACSAPDRAKPIARPTTPAPALPTAPGLRLPDSVTPLAYDLTLDIDPDQDRFDGEVRVRVRIDKPTDHVWLHTDALAIKSARYDGGELTQLPVRGDQMQAFGFGRVIEPRELELSFSYSGTTLHDQEGLFRQKSDNRWYVFSQGEAVFARRIAPCFDEPRFKTPWRVTLIVPRMQVALANAPETKQEAIERGRKRITFAETQRMPSYLLAIAVGPFDLVDAGTVGQNKIPVRVAVHAGAGKHVEVVAQKLPAIVDWLEAYTGEPLPLAKLDLVGVPRFFGAMENPGLVTFEERMLIGKPSKMRVETFTLVAAHELAHQWFGNLVTPAWWDDLWLSEAFATWLGEKIANELARTGDRKLDAVLARREALDADSRPDAIPLRRAIRNNQDPDEAFDAIAYQKGAAVLVTFEQLVGVDTFRTAMRDYLRAHRDRTATMQDLVAALARTTKPELGTAFEQYATRAGAPVVELKLECTGTPRVIARVRDGRLVPACVRAVGGKTSACALVVDQTELVLGGKCPAAVEGNPHAGYYTVHWQGRAATQGIAQLPPAARVMVGDDIAAALQRGDLAAKTAIAELRALLDAKDAHVQLGAIAVMRELDVLVDDATRLAWRQWLAIRVPVIKGGGKSRVESELASGIRDLLPERASSDPRMREIVDKMIAADRVPPPPFLELLAAKEGDALFTRIVERARATQDVAKQREWLERLGDFPPAFADRIAALATDTQLPIEPIWSALAQHFMRPDGRTAAWRALRTHHDAFAKRMPERRAAFVEITLHLCDQTSRDEVAKTFAGSPQLAHALANIDRCIARRAALGDLAAAIAASK